MPKSDGGFGRHYSARVYQQGRKEGEVLVKEGRSEADIDRKGIKEEEEEEGKGKERDKKDVKQ